MIPILQIHPADNVAVAPAAIEAGSTVSSPARNPFLNHRLSPVALNHDHKVRLLPSYDEFRRNFGRTPRLLAAVLETAGFSPLAARSQWSIRP